MTITPGKRSMNSAGIIAAGASAIFALGLAAPASASPPHYIAVAFDMGSGDEGTGSSGVSMQEAISKAMASCASHGAKNCRVQASGVGGCVAVSVDGNNDKMYGVWAALKSDAASAVIAKAGPGGRLASNDCVGEPAPGGGVF
jgi:Domain of unknown function (DUF4189)